ncbi:hypothetical protein AWL63_08395 [Sphingomonas panacis]|uniref:STAS domain-containing protein n=1 Tax=Sphingomonas panacis TaxID=1560345 RepID=A0A1B3Z976_9SPHN|nr:hypothetical protein [Sphingomonas panacis]AOH83983.1 hypothetical protein AWL63_08395 [Sphingomonas panacis]
MSVRVEAGMVHLAGRCLVEDAEPLLLALQDDAGAIVSLAGVTRLHMAVVQVLIAARAPLADVPADLGAVRFLLAL